MVTDYFNLGGYSRPVSTRSEQAQMWFDRGLTWAYAFNHEAAVACFEKSAAADSSCAMAHWGVAYSIGPYYNKQWWKFDPADLERTLAAAFDASRRAYALRDSVSAVEQLLIDAICAR